MKANRIPKQILELRALESINRGRPKKSWSDHLHVEASFEAFTVLIFQVEVFWFVTLCSVVVGYHRFRGP